MALTAQAAEPLTIAATPGEQAKITHDWPCYTGPDGIFGDPSKVALLEDCRRAKPVRVSEHEDLGWGKTYRLDRRTGNIAARAPRIRHRNENSGNISVVGG